MNNSYPTDINLSWSQYRPLPDDVTLDADFSHVDHPVNFIKDNQDATYWFSNRGFGTVTILFTKQEPISIVKIKTGFGSKKIGDFKIRAKVEPSHAQWENIGDTTVEVLPTTPDNPQTVHIPVAYGSYRLLQIVCVGVPLIHTLELE
ncbi:hypothetical protein NSS90_01040 [Bacillus sp. PS93]|uniref:hypothetical protein n=1 Tax=unclassified Bacillus (in: firmicutes) TaxID=185979 RepID=UPI0030D119EE